MRRFGLIALSFVVATAACGRNDRIATGTEPAPPLQPANGGPAAGTAPLQPANAPVGGPAGYSCSFPGAGGQTILARFTLDGPNARDDEGATFAVLTNSPTAVVLAKARDDVAAPTGDVGAYLVAIDKRDLSMVQSTVGVKGPASSRKGHCIAG